MSLKHAILGFLNMRPFSGYDLWKVFGKSVNNYWSATHTQVYRTLAELAKDKMVDAEMVRQQTSPNKKIYHITYRGREELVKWLKTPLKPPALRDKFLVQFTFSDALADEEIIRNFESYMEEIENKLNSLKSGEHQEYLKFARNEREKFLWCKTLEHGIFSYENELKWLKECLSSYKKSFMY